MNKQFFIELLRKFKDEKSSEKETRLLISYYKLFDQQLKEKVFSEQQEKEQIKQQIKERIWQQIDKNVPRFYNKTTPRQWIAIAAAIIFVVAFSVILYNTKKTVMAESLTSILNAQKENKLIHLPDGSTAILNVGSKLNFPSSFDQYTTREVYLEGEAFFDIKHDSSKPFIVQTGSLKTTVLGTAFNVKALPLDSQITVFVTRGKVKISKGEKILGLFTKGQEAIYHKKNDNFLQKTVAENSALTWKKQDIFFDDVTVEDASKLLEELFNISISFTDTAIKNNRFTTVMQKNEGVEEVIKSICEFNAAQYYYNKKTSTIIIRKNSTTTNLN